MVMVMMMMMMVVVMVDDRSGDRRAGGRRSDGHGRVVAGHMIEDARDRLAGFLADVFDSAADALHTRADSRERILCAGRLGENEGAGDQTKNQSKLVDAHVMYLFQRQNR
jgi:hypothetical protein